MRRLTSPDGRALLEEATRSYAIENEFALGTRLRRHHDGELVAAALTQARLRSRAVAKFAPDDAARMFFTVDGYEQATRASVATHRAARIASATGPALDLCCGIGGDLISLARAGLDVTGIEADELTADIARLNIEALGLGARARVLTADATAVDRTPFTVVTCDPSRRTARGRSFDVDAYQPSWPFVLDLLAEDSCVKVAPGIPRDRIPAGVEAEWISDDGDVKEAALWSGVLAEPGVRCRATILVSNREADPCKREADPAFCPGPSSRSVNALTDADDPGTAEIGPPGRFLYEPDGAVIRSGLVTAVAALTGGWLLDPSIAYISSDTLAPTPFARGFEITDVLPYDVKKLRRYVRERGIGTLTIKKRGVDVEPDQLRRTLRPDGTASATLVVTRVAGRATVIAATPLS
ncbi:class I SAM-dependent methyltransferase [Actinobacteria bacterium YIM 96077]|uniref:SAM-dependent methyltransferase n=1 Tax=Phytoactinopolyspora halophila TaxID=1981511 RepID=A0A329QGT1_9ACTN|nr:class I SAM-dependent methyltransferase [Actinobacteria bacterium YIM 96077]RAW11655.1 SAM-dependent methyltransferase [Phytoactinopolyspora halophila]